MNYFEDSLNVQISLADGNLGYLNNSGAAPSGGIVSSRQGGKQNNVIRVESCNGNKLLDSIPKQMYNKRAQSVETRTVSQRVQPGLPGSMLSNLNQNSEFENVLSPNVQSANARIDNKLFPKETFMQGFDNAAASYIGTGFTTAQGIRNLGRGNIDLSSNILSFQKPDNYNILLKHPKISKKSPLFDKFNLSKYPINLNGKKNMHGQNINAVNQSFSHQQPTKSREESHSPIIYIRGNTNAYTGNTLNTLMTQPNNNDILVENRVNSDAGLPMIQPYKEKLSNQYIEQNYFSNPTHQQKVYGQYSSQTANNSQNQSLEKERNINYNLIKLSDLNTNHHQGKVAQHYSKNNQQGSKKYGGIVINSTNNNNNTNFIGQSNTLQAGNNQHLLQKQQNTVQSTSVNTSRGYAKGMPSSSTQAVDEIIKNSSMNQNNNTMASHNVNKQISQSNPNSNYQSRAELHKNDTSPLLSLEQNATFSQNQLDTHLQSQGDILLSQIDLEPLGGNDNKKYNSQVGSTNNFDDQLTIFNKDKLFLNQNNISAKGSTLNIQFMNSSYNNADLLSINNDKLSLNNDILSVCNDKLSVYETASQGNTTYLNNLNLLHQNDSSTFLTRSMCDNNTLPHMNLLSQVSENLDSSTLPSSIHYANYLQNNIINRRKNSKQIVDELLGNNNSYNTTLEEIKPQQIFSAFPQQRRNSFRKRNVYSVHQPYHNYQQIPSQQNNQLLSDRRHNNQRFETTAQFQQQLLDQKDRATKDKQHMKLSEVVNRAGEVLNTKYLQEEIVIEVQDKKFDPSTNKQQKSSENNLQEKNFSFFQVAQQQNGKKQKSNQGIKEQIPQINQQQIQQPIKLKEISKSAQQTPKNVNDLSLQVFSSGINQPLNSRRNISPPKVLPVIQIEKENDFSANRIELDFQKQRKSNNQPEQIITKSKGRRFKSIDNQKSTTSNNQQQNTSSYQPSTFELESQNVDKFQL